MGLWYNAPTVLDDRRQACQLTLAWRGGLRERELDEERFCILTHLGGGGCAFFQLVSTNQPG